MRRYKGLIILLNLLVILFLFNTSIFEKEKILKEGKLVLLKFAPVDPRSLMQGDYMQLSYEIAQDIKPDSISKRGYCIITLDSLGIAHRLRFQDDINPLKTGEYAIVYTQGQWSINIGAESYFFEEGKADHFETAKYGGIQIDNKGNGVLIGLFDENRKKLE